MLRSLVGSKSADGTFTIQRNVTNGDLEKALSNGAAAWIDISTPVEEDLPWLEECFNLHPAVMQDLKRDDHRPTLLVYPEYIFLSLFQPQFQLKQTVAHEVHCIIGDNYFLTVRRADTRTVDEAYDRIAKNEESWKRDHAYFLYLTIQFVIDSYYPLLDKINLNLNNLETAALAGEKISQYEIYHIKHRLMKLRQMLGPQREALSDLIGQERLIREPENRDLFRHLYERLLRVYDTLDSQRDFTSNVLDLVQNQEASRLANAVNRLTILSMILLPLTFMISVFELNFITTDPGLVIPMSGEIVLSLILTMMAALGGVLVWFFRSRGWL